ncbi:FAD-dependent oxidoreductase [Devosia algicola]|uniref:FAD-dependent oxidoreductase n=1 Tax=Devosia algicola TaxID=3026418 RepID=A0ABY7YM00_9HYPH|nr:FAD-dependent oxidoreductase [Devosia algicola]WDR02217.1 FAD-dependent oxidoreductase [Devosia algicola]
MPEYLKPDICIIGAGAGGLAAAKTACGLGASVVLVESGSIGGDINLGSVPAHALIAAGYRAHLIRTSGEFGIADSEPKVNFRGIQSYVQSVVKAVSRHEGTEQLASRDIEVIAATGKFVDKRTLQAGETLIRARRFIIATGSAPAVPDIAGLADIDYFTTDTIFENFRKLTHLVIVGGGPAGIEMAQAYCRLGCAVSLVDKGEVLGRHDRELVEITLRRLREEGVDIREQSVVSQIEARSQGIGVRIKNGAGEEDVLDASHVLIATGRQANIGDLELGTARVATVGGKSGRLRLNKFGRTSNFRIYAIGSAAGGHAQLPEIEHQATISVRRALLGFAANREPDGVAIGL